MREPVNDKHPARRDRRRVRRRGSRGTPDHDARRAHAIDDPRRDRGRGEGRRLRERGVHRGRVCRAIHGDERGVDRDGRGVYR